MDETIFAPVTASGIAAVSVFRFSGRTSSNILKLLIKKKKLPSERKLVLQNIFIPNSNELLDVCLICWMPSPNSFTGEDSFEIQSHGGAATSQLLIEVFSKIKGVRFAEPGEFSKRAIMNGKMDLVQAEAINQIVLAETEKQRAINIRQLTKGLSIPIKHWRKKIINCLSKIEASIDFSDEDGVPETIDITNELRKIAKDIIQVLEKGNNYELITTGAKVTLTGPPNSGKSSLFNYIIKKQKSIVTKTPGTTRDVVEKKINLKGIPVIFLDTAGIRETRNLVEKEGIKKAKAAIKEADIILKIQDISKQKSNKNKKPISKRSWIVFNKIDKTSNIKKQNEESREKTFYVSAKTGKGVDRLLNKIHKHVLFRTDNIEEGDYFFSNERQKADLKKALLSLQAAINEKEEEIIAEYLRVATHSLERILGKIDVEDVLGNIFSSFCIGK